MSEWKEYKLGDLGTFFGGVTTIKREDYGFGTPFISYKNVYKNSKIDISLIELMNVKKSDILKRNCLFGDIFFTASSETPDEVAMSSVLLDSIDNLTFNGFCKRFRLHNFDILIPQYARYLFRGEDFRNSAYEYANGDVRFNISQENLSKIIIKIPDLPTQTAIAEILSSLDDKIELNNKINQELEDLAQTLFKRWFIDFEFPNENGDPYKSSGGEMVDSELGEIPKGWGVRKFENIVKISTGKGVNKSNFQVDGEYPVIGANGIMGFYTNYNIEGFRILTGRVGTLGTVRISNEKAWTSDNVLICEPFYKEYNHYSFFMMKDFDFNSLNRGSTQPLITQSDLKLQTILLPQKNILTLFQNQMDYCLSMLENNYSENKNLIKIRDTLLPKLISGELELSQIQNIP